jgi:hypothetical protein
VEGNKKYDLGPHGPEFERQLQKLPQILDEAAFRAMDQQEHLAEPDSEYRYEGPPPANPSQNPQVFNPEEVDWGLPDSIHGNGVV